MHALRVVDLAGAGTVRQLRDGAEGTTQPVGVVGELRDHGGRSIESTDHRRGQRGQPIRPGRLGGKRLGQRVVDLRGGHPEPLRLAGEVTADLVGVQVGLREQVADARQRELPAVARGAEELLQHRELERLLVVAGLQPAEQRGDVLALALGQCAVDDHVGVASRRDLAEDLHQRVVAECHRGVALLPGEQRRVGVGVEVVTGQPDEPEIADVRRPARGVAGTLEGCEPARGGLAVVHGVVRVHDAEVLVVPRAHVCVGQPLLLVGVVGKRHLVLVGAARRVVVRECHQLDADLRARVRLGGQHPEAAHVDHTEVAALAAEPARRLHVAT